MKNKKLNVSKHVPYEVDFDYLEENVQFFLEVSNKEEIKTSFLKIIDFFSDKKISEPVDESFSDVCVVCDDVTYKIRCKNLIARQVLAVILNLQNEKKPLWCLWCLYDYNSCNEMPQFIHSFFLAADSKIQLDNVQISTSWMNECDQNILVEASIAETPDSSMPLWSNMEEDLKARVLWYYQKFYQETENGQILAIRDNLKLLESEKFNIFLPSKIFSSCSSYSSVDNALLFSINSKLKWAVIILGAILLKIFF